ncbi:stage II sporulation protein M [Aliiglaciecola sp. 2_MG-2023]|uniref:stage II sporulation protein M n=1 Tax=unclassified Aliiglaciecola TaxID=2593648 RepID=UPI0026E36EB3|nr:MULTISPECIES: stage II sporulation protein M [unclassified Aliiglaciecola]MDO6713133.1 stage II sporulation protein M [Aliiglaciecola sp. 2_MG-2023]MDO6754193.1 stage II sporulation protein M [Aliiglaciecola sp. 1_MG-2023]
MKQHDFIQSRQKQWSDFAEAIKDPNKLHEYDIDLPHAFRQLTHDLAVAKSRLYSPALISRLNDLLLQGQQCLYKPSNRVWAPFWQFVKYDFPAQLLLIRRYVIWAHILFYGLALITFSVTMIEPEFVGNVMPNSQVTQLEQMYDPASRIDETTGNYRNERDSDSDFLMFGFYIKNNISIAFQCFVGGFLLGFGTLYYLLFNAIFFGAVSAHIVNVGFSSTFFSFVITHGSFELTAIVLSAAAGGVVGMHIIRPGQLSRTAALKQAGKITFPIIFGAFLMLVVAAFIEAFWSSSTLLPNAVKYAVGSACWLWILLYIFPRNPRSGEKSS